jgi:hypothetical protein
MHFYQTSFNSIAQFTLPAKVQIRLHLDRLYFASCTPVYTSDDVLGQVHINIGIKDYGFCPALLAHEANHCTQDLLSIGRWKSWAPKWPGIKYQKEETTSWLIESIVQQGTRLAMSYEIPMHIPVGVHTCKTSS